MPTAASTTRIPNNVRVELFFKDEDDLRRRVRFLSSEYGVKSFNLVNKNKRDQLLRWLDIVRETEPDASVCAHFSVKYNKSRAGDGAVASFRAFRNHVDGRDGSGDHEILVVTGSGPKGKFDSVAAVRQFAAMVLPITRCSE